MGRERDERGDFTYDSTQNLDAEIADTRGVGDDITGPELGGNPATRGLTAGGTGMALEETPEEGGPGGSGGGVVDRIGGIETTGGTPDSAIGGTIVGSGIPPKPSEDIDLNGAP